LAALGQEPASKVVISAPHQTRLNQNYQDVSKNQTFQAAAALSYYFDFAGLLAQIFLVSQCLVMSYIPLPAAFSRIVLDCRKIVG